MRDDILEIFVDGKHVHTTSKKDFPEYYAKLYDLELKYIFVKTCYSYNSKKKGT